MHGEGERQGLEGEERRSLGKSSLLLRILTALPENNEKTLGQVFGKREKLSTFALPNRKSGKAAQKGLSKGLVRKAKLKSLGPPGEIPGWG